MLALWFLDHTVKKIIITGKTVYLSGYLVHFCHILVMQRDYDISYLFDSKYTLIRLKEISMNPGGNNWITRKGWFSHPLVDQNSP